MSKEKTDQAPEKADAAEFFASEAQAQIAAAWAELVQAAKSDPKARAFLDAFGPGPAEPVPGDAGK
jgi:hypothetical protein